MVSWEKVAFSQVNIKTAFYVYTDPFDSYYN